MAKNLDLLDASVYTRHSVPWQIKRGKYVIAKMPYTAWSPTAPQLAQRIKLARAANGLFGTRGKVFYKGVNMPAIAYQVGRQVTGSTGGIPLEQRRQLKHEAAGASIQAMESKLAQLGGAPRQPSPALPGAGGVSYQPAGGARQAGLRRYYI